MLGGKKDRALIVVVVVATAVVLLPKLTNQFVYDDVPVFVLSDRVHDVSNVPSFFAHNTMYVADRNEPIAVDTYRPLTLTTFALDSVLTGKAPVGYHVTNLLIHLLCVWLVYRLARVVLCEENRAFAWVAAAWFSFSPWLGEAHVWINGRSDPLCTMFVLASLLVWDRGLTSKRMVLQVAGGTLFLAALFCKEVAIGVLPTLWFWPRLVRAGAPWRERLVAMSLPATAAAAYLGVRTVVLGGLGANAGSAHLLESVRNFGVLVVDALRAVIVPTTPYLRSLVESYVPIDPVLRWVLTAAAVVLLLLAVLGHRRQPALSWSVLFFAATLAPVVMVSTLIWPGFGRYLYLPFAGLCVGLVDVCVSGLRRVGAFDRKTGRTAVAAGVGAYFAVNAALLFGFVGDFENDGTLYGAAMEHAPNHAYGYAYLGAAMSSIGRSEEALPYLEKAVSLQPYEPEYRIKYAQALIHSGREPRAAELASQWANSGRPSDVPRYLMTWIDAEKQVHPDRALALAEACVRDFPEHRGCRARLDRLASDASE
jgi:hypothetical protein